MSLSPLLSTDPSNPIVIITSTGDPIAGVSFTFKCLLLLTETTNASMESYTWRQLDSDTGTEVGSGGSSGPSDRDAGSVLEFNPLKVSNGGVYQCTVTFLLSPGNGSVFNMSEVANLTVRSKSTHVHAHTPELYILYMNCNLSISSSSLCVHIKGQGWPTVCRYPPHSDLSDQH